MANGAVEQYVVAGLWALTAVAIAWNLIPAVLANAGHTRYENGGEDTPPDETDAEEPEYLLWADQLRKLGYEPIGVGWFRMVFIGDQWGRTARVRVFHSREYKRYAYVQKEDRPFDFFYTTTFSTVWSGGGLLETASLSSPVNKLPESEDDFEYIRAGHTTFDLEELHGHHEAMHAKLKATGRSPDSGTDVETLLRAKQDHAAPRLLHFSRRAGKMYLFATVMFHVSISLPVGVALGLGHWGLPVTNIVMVFITRFGLFSDRARKAAAFREALLGARRMREAGGDD